jgi:hypothetical protein
VRLRQIGTLRTNVRRERWMAFEAEHIVAPRSTGFVWNARVAVAPLLHVRVGDALVAGRGSGQVSLLSAFTVAADAGTPEMNSGSLHRYLAEAVWYPTALLPSAKLRWSAVDNRRALATLTEDGVTVSLEFRFADTGQGHQHLHTGSLGQFRWRVQTSAMGGSLPELHGTTGHASSDGRRSRLVPGGRLASSLEGTSFDGQL